MLDGWASWRISASQLKAHETNIQREIRRRQAQRCRNRRSGRGHAGVPIASKERGAMLPRHGRVRQRSDHGAPKPPSPNDSRPKVGLQPLLHLTGTDSSKSLFLPAASRMRTADPLRRVPPCRRSTPTWPFMDGPDRSCRLGRELPFREEFG